MERGAGEVVGAGFATTRWTLVGDLRSDDESVRRAAGERLASVYWPAVYAAARRLAHTRDEAADLTQGFFAEVVLGRRLFLEADPARGRLRSLVLAALRRYATDQWRRGRARAKTVPLGDFDREEGLGVEGGAGEAFDRRWVLSLVEEALRRCEAHFAAGKPGHWALFEARVVRPAVGGCPAGDLCEEARALGFSSAPAAAAAVQTVKRRLEAVLREVVAETLTNGADAEEEYRLVRALLEGPAGRPASG